MKKGHSFKLFLRVITLVIACVPFNELKAQNQPRADSLINVLNRNELDSLTTLRTLWLISASSSSAEDIIHYAELLLKTATDYKNKLYVSRGLRLKGIGYRSKGDLENSLKFLFQSCEFSIENDFKSGLATDYGEIATTYTLNDDSENALLYNTKAIQILRKTTNKSLLALTLLNTGYDYYSANKYDTSLLYYSEAEEILDSLNSSFALIYLKGNRALVKWKQGNVDEAIFDLNEAIEMLEGYGDNYGMADYYNQLGNIYLEQDSLEQAVFNLSTGVRLAKGEDLKEQVRDASKLLSEIYGKLGESDSAYHYLNQYLAMRDSIQSEETTRELANQRADFEIGLKEEEVEKLEQERQQQLMIAIASGGLLIILGFIGYRYQQNRSRKKLEKQSIDKRLAELTALKAQINPHFLFNALNSIQSYILEGEQDIAEDYLIKYGKLMRMILDHSNDLLVPLDEELRLLRLYIELEQIRIDGGFDYEVEVDEAIDQSRTNIPSMVIQPFLENAIWHGVSKLGGKGIIQLHVHLDASEELIRVTVQDNGEGFDTEEPRKDTSKGVNLVKERLELLKESKGSKSAMTINSQRGDGTKVSLSFPAPLR